MTATVRSPDEVLDPPTLTSIHHRARHLIGRFGFTASDLPDLEQDLALDLLRRAGGYNPERAQWQTFVARCANHRIADIIRYRCTRMRNHARACALDLSDDRSPCRGAERGDTRELQDVRIDLAGALAALPVRLRQLCHRLMTTSISEIAAEDGSTRWRVYRDIEDIRVAFLRAGLSTTA